MCIKVLFVLFHWQVYNLYTHYSYNSQSYRIGCLKALCFADMFTCLMNMKGRKRKKRVEKESRFACFSRCDALGVLPLTTVATEHDEL